MRTYNIPFSVKQKKRKSPYIILNLQLWDIFQGTQELVRNSRGKFETAIINEPSVFEPLKFYPILFFDQSTESSDSTIWIKSTCLKYATGALFCKF